MPGQSVDFACRRRVSVANDVSLNRYLREQARDRSIDCPDDYDFLGFLRSHAQRGGFHGYEEDAAVVEIFYTLVCQPGSLWGYQVQYGTRLDQRWATLVASRIKDHRRNRGRRLRRQGEVSLTDSSDDAAGVQRDVIDDTVPVHVSDPDDHLGGFREFLQVQRQGRDLLEMLDLQLAEDEPDPHRWTAVQISGLQEDLRFYLGLYAQRYPSLSDELENRLSRRETEASRSKSQIRCFADGNRLVEVRLVAYSRVRGLAKIEMADRSGRWVDPRDLYEPVARNGT